MAPEVVSSAHKSGRKMNFQKLSAWSGIIGCLVSLVCAYLASRGYSGIHCESYSIFNHFISELGDRRIAVGSSFFNAGMVVSSVFLTIFGVGFTMNFRGWQRVVVGILALVTGISCGLVGLFPVDILLPHLLVAMIFFHSALALVFFCTGLTFFSKQPVLPKWTVVPGIITAVFFAAFVLWPNDVVRLWVRHPDRFSRPEIWWHPILEWGCFFSIILWLLIVTTLVLLQRVGRKVLRPS